MTKMSLYAVYLSLLFFTACDSFDDESRTLRHAEIRILDRIQSALHHYLDDDNVKNVDLNLMLGVSIMKARKILDHRLWTSPRKITHKSPTSFPRGFNEDFITNDDLYFRNISDTCIHQVITTCEITPECIESELMDDFFGYALTHQVLYFHILKKMNCNGPIFQKVTKKVIHDKCSKIFNEALHISNDFDLLEKYKDLLIEQIAVCGMQNMVEFIRPEWFSIVSSKKHFYCIQRTNENSSCDSHLSGVSLAALGVYWKFLCYKTNTYRLN